MRHAQSPDSGRGRGDHGQHAGRAGRDPGPIEAFPSPRSCIRPLWTSTVDMTLRSCPPCPFCSRATSRHLLIQSIVDRRCTKIGGKVRFRILCTCAQGCSGSRFLDRLFRVGVRPPGRRASERSIAQNRTDCEPPGYGSRGRRAGPCRGRPPVPLHHCLDGPAGGSTVADFLPLQDLHRMPSGPRGSPPTPTGRT